MNEILILAKIFVTLCIFAAMVFTGNIDINLNGPYVRIVVISNLVWYAIAISTITWIWMCL
jgi:hypothetical protein